MRSAGEGKLQMHLCFAYGILFLFALWITKGSASLEYPGSSEIEVVVEVPLPSPTLNTEPFPLSDMESNEVTSEAATGDIYDQISPSRNPTTPLSRNLFRPKKNNWRKFPTPSTVATMLNAPPPPPPPFYLEP